MVYDNLDRNGTTKGLESLIGALSARLSSRDKRDSRLKKGIYWDRGTDQLAHGTYPQELAVLLIRNQALMALLSSSGEMGYTGC
jgi:hypothetical protein